MKPRKGFTLIELMLTMAIIGLLASLAFPRFANLVGKAKDAALKGRLGGLRGAFTIFYADHEGTYPNWTVGPDYTYGGLVPTYISKIPVCETIYHVPSTILARFYDNTPGPNMNFGSLDQATWIYVSGESWKSLYGHVWIACTHPDTKGIPYSTY
jgi:prepilin-type N-terminal cleavage/methylation domain-containing protein